MKKFLPFLGTFFLLTQQNIALAHPGGHGKDLITELDSNKDSLLSLDEVKSNPFLTNKFDEIDTNKDKQLSADELKAHRQAHHPHHPPAPPASESSSDSAE